MGLDLGPSIFAVVSEAAARLDHFCAELDPQAAEIRRGQRQADHLDRQHRANHPENYLPNGPVKKGRRGRKPWRESQRRRRQRQTPARLTNRQRRQAAHRQSLHGQLAQQLVRQGSSFLLEKDSYRAGQRRYGRSIQRRAPGTCVQIVTRLAESAGGTMITVPTPTTKLSQTCQWGKEQTKPLSLRVHHAEQGGLQMQRDLYAAYLIRFVNPDTCLLHARHAQEAWPGAESLLRAAWQQALPHPTTGKRRGQESQPRTTAQGRGASEPVVRSRFTSQVQEPGCCNGTSVRAGSRRPWCGPEPPGLIRERGSVSGEHLAIARELG